VRHVQDKMAVYAASKAGVIGFTKSVALGLSSRNIRCNAIAPGFIETEMTAKLNDDVVQGWRDGIPLKRGGTTEDVVPFSSHLRYERLRNRTM
jgi:3-oxoacyl-[acyl-carrier protein] reductase